jgi:phosphoenolpyruvate-protein phosphotransferase
MARLTLLSPLAGWALPVEEIPDPVFAQRMVGDGVGIDPVNDLLHAPCDGRVFPIAGASHALSLRPVDGGEILLHLGIDTVKLGGAGFQSLVGEGELVRAGQPLLRFDLDLIARHAPSAVTPILLPAGGVIHARATQALLAVGDFLMEVEFDAATPATDAGAEGPELRENFRLSLEHGLHARPAAQLAAALRPFVASVRLRASAGEVDARSTTALMALGTRRGDSVEVIVRGADAAAAMAAVSKLLGSAPPAAAPAATAATGFSSTGELPGRIASRGLALGTAVVLRAQQAHFAASSTDPEAERANLRAALTKVQARLKALAAAQSGPGKAILEAHCELVADPGLEAQAAQAIATGASAARAWEQAVAGAEEALAGLDDARMRERVADLRDIGQQVLLALAGDTAAGAALPESAIVLADELLPSQLLALPRARLAGIATAQGGTTSHMAIIAAALGVPALVGLGRALLEVADGEALLLDAERGSLQRAPSAEQSARLSALLAAREQQAAADLAAADAPAHTRDGVHVSVYANLGAVAEADLAARRGADGCGLLRTEFLYLDRATPPGEDEQFALYRQISDRLAPRPLVIRTMDIGGDKPIAYLPLPHEDNPALGLRGLRTSLAHVELLRTQLRAVLRLRSPHARLLLPMVNELSELRAARAILRECADELGIESLPPLGVMVETPAAAMLATQLLREADFASIGSNDLSQYTLAIDRGHPELSARLDALHPAVLRLIGSVAAAGEMRGREVAVCGGLASDPDAVALLVGLGIRELSAVPASIPMLKRIVRSLDAANCRELARRALELEDAGAVRALVASWPGASQEKEVQR